MNGEASASVSALDSLINSMREKLESQSHLNNPFHGHPPTISRVPQSMRRYCDEDIYDPKILSLGPFHHGIPNLEPMEKHKWRYLHDLLSLNPQVSLETYLKEIRSLEEMARGCYSETFEQLSSEEFVEMMLLDGCFIVEFLIKLRDSSLEFIFTTKEIQEPIFNTMWILPPVVHDMLLLENQVPFFILQRVFDLAVERSTGHSLMELAFIMFNCLVPLNDEISPMPTTSVHHLLHLFHTHILPSSKCINNANANSSVAHNFSHIRALFNTHLLPIASSRLRLRQALSPPTTSERKAKSIPSVTELQAAGVKFKKKVKKVGSFMEIEFKNGIMTIPELYFYPNANSFFRNLIAFEQCYPNSKTHFTAYAMFMDKFINSTKDVMLLKQQGIIQHGLGTDKELAHIFNQLGKGVNFYYSKTYLSPVYTEVKQYYETDWHKWRASLMHQYFSNPWAFFSLVGALVLLILTITQTVFSILTHFSCSTN